MPTDPATKKLRQKEKLSLEAKQTITEFLNLHKTIDYFSGCEVRNQNYLFVLGLNMMIN